METQQTFRKEHGLNENWVEPGLPDLPIGACLGIGFVVLLAVLGVLGLAWWGIGS